VATKGAGRHVVSVKRRIAQVRHRYIHLCVVNARHVRVMLSERFVCDIVLRVRVVHLCSFPALSSSRVLWRGGCTLTDGIAGSHTNVCAQ
jgi:hypothetical protein